MWFEQSCQLDSEKELKSHSDFCSRGMCGELWHVPSAVIRSISGHFCALGENSAWDSISGWSATTSGWAARIESAVLSSPVQSLGCNYSLHLSKLKVIGFLPTEGAEMPVPIEMEMLN